MAEPVDMIVPLLREMREESATRHGETLKRFDLIDRRLDALEEAQKTFRHALTADSLLSKLVTGEFEERIELLEQKVATIELLERKVRELEALK